MDILKIGIIGGTGKEGSGLAYRWVKAGHNVVIGSRDAQKASETASKISSLVGDKTARISGSTNEDAVRQCDIIVLTVPFSVHNEILTELKDELVGKILIDVTVPLVPPQISKVQMPTAGSATLEACRIVGEKTQVIAAFQNISHLNLYNPGYDDCDVLVCGGDRISRDIVLGLVSDTGLKAWDGGPVENSAVVEGLTSILLGINKKYGLESAGIKITSGE